jgi:fumarate reductase subunit D
MRGMDAVFAALATFTSLVNAYPLAATALLAFGPIAIVALARNPVGAVIVIGLVIMGLGLALEVTQDGINVRPFESDVLRMALALWGALWPIAIAFLIFGRPPVYASAGNARPQSG